MTSPWTPSSSSTHFRWSEFARRPTKWGGRTGRAPARRRPRPARQVQQRSPHSFFSRTLRSRFRENAKNQVALSGKCQISGGRSSHGGRRSGAGGRDEPRPDADLVLRVKYNNALPLPDIPFDPKFLIYPFDPSRFVQYKPTSLEKNYRFELLTEPDLGVHIDLINPETYEVSEMHQPVMDPADERLLEDEPIGGSTPGSDRKKAGGRHSKIVPWLRKTEYISAEFNRYGVSTERNETQVGYNVKKKIAHELVYKDRDSQMAAIQQTFDAVKDPVLQHYSKPGVKAVQELPVFPDFTLWKWACAQVMFDADPVPQGHDRSSASQALIRGMMDESGEQFVAYFLPTDETLDKRKTDGTKDISYDPTETYDYKLAREYNWNVKNKASKGYEENYFLVFRDDAVYYDELETRVRLNKRRHKEGVPRVSNSRLLVKHREINEQEEGAQDMRLTQLAPETEDFEDEVQAVDPDKPDGDAASDFGADEDTENPSQEKSTKDADDDDFGGENAESDDDQNDAQTASAAASKSGAKKRKAADAEVDSDAESDGDDSDAENAPPASKAKKPRVVSSDDEETSSSSDDD